MQFLTNVRFHRSDIRAACAGSICVALLALSSVACSAEEAPQLVFPVFAPDGLPALFQAYPAEFDAAGQDLASSPPELRPHVADAFLQEYGQMISDGQSKAVNFGGHYRLEEWGCGSSCQTGVIIDLLTGDTWELPTSEWGRQYQRDSLLLIENPPRADEGSRHRPEYAFPVYHLWQDQEWKLLCDTREEQSCVGAINPSYD